MPIQSSASSARPSPSSVPSIERRPTRERVSPTSTWRLPGGVQASAGSPGSPVEPVAAVAPVAHGSPNSPGSHGQRTVSAGAQAAGEAAASPPLREFVRTLQNGEVPGRYSLGYEALDLDLDESTRRLVMLYLAGSPVSAMRAEKDEFVAALQERRRAIGSHAPATAGVIPPSVDAPPAISDEQLQAAADIVERMVAGSHYRSWKKVSPPPPPLTAEPHGARMLFDAVRAAGGDGAFTAPSRVAGLGRWADALPALVQRVEAGGRVPGPKLAALRDGTRRAAAALHVMTRAPQVGHLRTLLLLELLGSVPSPDGPAAGGAPVDNDQMEGLGSALMGALFYWSRGVPPYFREAGHEAIRDAHDAGLLDAAQRAALDNVFDRRVDAEHRQSQQGIFAQPERPEPRRATTAEPRSGRSGRPAPHAGFRGLLARIFSTKPPPSTGGA